MWREKTREVSFHEPALIAQKNLRTRGVLQTLSREKQCQKNGVKKMKLARCARKKGGVAAPP
jgi:hypothetical protein